jgi:hypothetical protein
MEKRFADAILDARVWQKKMKSIQVRIDKIAHAINEYNNIASDDTNYTNKSKDIRLAVLRKKMRLAKSELIRLLDFIE